MKIIFNGKEVKKVVKAKASDPTNAVPITKWEVDSKVVYEATTLKYFQVSNDAETLTIQEV